MHLSDLLRPERVLLRQSARSKKNLLELASQVLTDGQPDLAQRSVFAALCERERIGSTGLGHGVAIPHGRIDHLDEARVALLSLREPVAFDGPDDQPVDLVFAIAVPDNHHSEHVELLAEIAGLLSDPAYRTEMRAAEGPNRLLARIRTWQLEGASA